MMSSYEAPKIEVDMFATNDVVSTSGSPYWDDFIKLPDVGMQ